MRVLCFDTSSEVGVVGVLVEGALRASLSARVEHRHGETLLPHVEQVLSLAGVAIADVELIAVGLGPGSFTGVRIGLATAKGLALARGTPLVGVRTSRVLARGAHGALRGVTIDAKKNEVFFAAYEASADGTLQPLLEDRHGSPREAAEALALALGSYADACLVGSAIVTHGALLREVLGTHVSLLPQAWAAPSPAILGEEALEALGSRGPDDPATLVPVYVRGADVTLPAAR